MKRITATAIALALSAAAAGGAVAGFQDYGRGYDSRYDANDRMSRSDVATVVSARPVYDRYASQGYERQECWNERTNAYDDGYYRDSSGRLYRQDPNANGTVIGALIGGALGNVIDRLRWGAVADFFYFHYEDWYWPAFNIADSCITIAAGLLIIDFFMQLKAKKAAEHASDSVSKS